METINLAVDRVSFAFGGTKVLEGICAEFVTSEIGVVLGPSGCGKSTLLNLIAGLLEPSEGSIRFSGAGRPKGVGYVFQDPCLMPWRTVRANAELGAEIQGLRNESTRRHAQRLLNLYGLGAFEDSYPNALSGGMRQRLALIRAVVSGTRILLLDEPFSDSDFMLRRSLQSDLVDLVNTEALTAIMVTHDLEEALFLADRIYVLSARPARVLGDLRIDLAREERRTSAPDGRDRMRRYLEQIWDLLGQVIEPKEDERERITA